MTWFWPWYAWICVVDHPGVDSMLLLVGFCFRMMVSNRFLRHFHDGPHFLSCLVLCFCMLELCSLVPTNHSGPRDRFHVLLVDFCCRMMVSKWFFIIFMPDPIFSCLMLFACQNVCCWSLWSWNCSHGWCTTFGVKWRHPRKMLVSLNIWNYVTVIGEIKISTMGFS